MPRSSNTGKVVAQRKVLIVEPDVNNRTSLGDLLESRGHRVHLAATGEEGMAAAAMLHPDVVFIDLGLPDMEGERAIAAMKAAIPSSPFVVAYTGFQRREADARRAGCDAFVLKPSVDLLLAIAEALDLRLAAQRGATH